MFDKLINGWKAKNLPPEQEQQQEETPAEQPQEVDTELQEFYQSKLKEIVYDDELVEQFTNVFMQLGTKEGLAPILDLLENKENQLKAIADGSGFKKETPSKETKIENEQGSPDSNQESFSVESYISQINKRGNK